MLGPIFDEAADKVAAEFPEAGRVVLGKVDCDKESKLYSDNVHLYSYLADLTQYLYCSINRYKVSHN